MRSSPIVLVTLLAVGVGCSAQVGEGDVGQSNEAVGAGLVYNFGTLAHPGSCMDAFAAGTADGTQIQEYACNGTGAQSFALQSAGSGVYNLVNTNANRCVDVNAAGTANGTKVQLWDCNGTGAQQWRWRNQNRLVNPQSGRCLDVTNGSTADGTRLQIWDCNGTAAQAWYLP